MCLKTLYLQIFALFLLLFKLKNYVVFRTENGESIFRMLDF